MTFDERIAQLNQEVELYLQLEHKPINKEISERLIQLMNGVKRLEKGIEQSKRKIEKNRAHIEKSQDTISKGDDVIALVTKQYEHNLEKHECEKELIDATLEFWKEILPRNRELMDEIIKQNDAFINYL